MERAKKKKLFGKWIFKEMFCLVMVYPAYKATVVGQSTRKQPNFSYQ